LGFGLWELELGGLMLQAVPGHGTMRNLGDVKSNALGMKPVLALRTEHTMLTIILFSQVQN
jgi:hypothetical protein